MSTAEKLLLYSVDAYLNAEDLSSTRSEYINGLIRAMTGATNRHNTVSINVQGILWSQLKGRTCRPFNSDTKIRVRRGEGTSFYYPDASVVCDSNRATETFQDKPVVVIEVLSPSTRSIDLDEKLTAYLSIDSLQAYILLEQDKPLAIVMRRTPDGFLREVYEGAVSIIELPTIACTLLLDEVYTGVDFTPASVQEPEANYETPDGSPVHSLGNDVHRSSSM